MQINCPSCGNTCEVDGILAIGQHLICPFCSKKFVYSDIEQEHESLKEDHSEERGLGEITVRCPHCGTEYEVDKSVEGAACQCSICNKNFVVKGIHPTVETEENSSVSADRRKHTGSKAHGRTMTFGGSLKAPGSNINTSNSLSPQKNGRYKKFLVLLALLATCILGTLIFTWVKNDKQIGNTDDSDVTKVAKNSKRQEVEKPSVQLWADGPCWATTNIGADDPWDYGYYFWWGDTVGYKRQNDSWVSSDGSSSYSNFWFKATESTYNKSIATLKEGGWITENNVLAPEHDAAQVLWGGGWRMPTRQELTDLCHKCDWTLTKKNGVNGYVVCGRGDYASESIFLPCAGEADPDHPRYVGSNGSYWSSHPNSNNDHSSWQLSFKVPRHAYDTDSHDIFSGSRNVGVHVRPVKEAAQGQLSINRQQSKTAKAKELYQQGMRFYEGKGSYRDYDRAFRYFSDASELGYLPADAMLSHMYYCGQGCKKDEAKSFILAEKGVSCDDEDASNMAKITLGTLYLFGFVDTKGHSQQDNYKAYKYIRGTIVNYGTIYLWGLMEYHGVGTMKNAKKAARCFDALSDAKDDYLRGAATMCIGQLFYKGDGVEKNRVLAWKLLRMGAKTAFPELIRAAKSPLTDYDIEQFDLYFGQKISFWTPYSWKMYNLYKGKGNLGVFGDVKIDLLEQALRTLFNPDCWVTSGVEYNFNDM